MPETQGPHHVDSFQSGVEYQIEVKNPNGVCKGVKSVTVDGKKVAGNVIPYEAGKKIVKVEITLEA